MRAYSKAKAHRPPDWFISSALIIASILLLGGTLYNLLEKPLVAYFVGEYGRPILYHPGAINDQLLGESLAVMALYVMGTSGLLLLYRSTRYAHRPRQAYIMLMAGLVLLIMSYAIIEMILRAKLIY